MPILNPFGTDAFNMVSLSASINILPNQYGLLEQLGIFPEQPVTLRSIIIEEQNGVLNLLKAMPVGSPGQKADRSQRVARSFQIPHIPYDDSILPQEYEGVRAFGSENQFETLSRIMNDHLQTMRNKHDITLEWLRLGALKGIIYDGDGTTVIANLYKEFLIKPKAIDFVLGTTTTDIKAKCHEVKRWIEDHLLGEIMRGDPMVLCDPNFFDAFTGHAEVKDAYKLWDNGAALRNDMRSGFPFGGLLFREYSATVSDANGTPRTFFSSKRGIAFPRGTANTFRTFVAPADFLDTVNTLGQRMYARQEERKFNRGIDVHTQSNPLPMCMRPGVLVEVFSSN